MIQSMKHPDYSYLNHPTAVGKAILPGHRSVILQKPPAQYPVFAARYATMDIDGWSENSGIGTEAAQVERVSRNNFFIINKTTLKAAPN
jgi:hypothetical protein